MIDILVYLFENYLPDACPETEVLARKLSAAGFGSDDISAALAWLDGLAGPEGGRCSPPALAGSIRIYGEEKLDRLSTACRGFISFLEQNGAIDASLREAIIERALALTDDEITLDRLKVIVLAVVWRYRHEVDALILEEPAGGIARRAFVGLRFISFCQSRNLFDSERALATFQTGFC